MNAEQLGIIAVVHTFFGGISFWVRKYLRAFNRRYDSKHGAGE